jgi:Leucine-rich repeat (LRR) protein
MAAVSANTPAISPPEQKPRRRWFQFSLRTALLLMFLASLFFAGFAWRRNRAERQRQIVAELRELGADVEYSYFSLTKRRGFNIRVSPSEEFFLCAWLRRFCGDDFVYDVNAVYIVKSVPPEATRSALVLIKKLPELKRLCLDGDAITAADLRALPSLTSLEMLSLASRSAESSRTNRGGRLTDSDLTPLEGATQLQGLTLEYQPIGDAGIAHLRNCRKLQILYLGGTNVGDEGLEHLSELTELENLELQRSRVTDAGLKSLRNLNKLQVLWIGGNELTGAGFADVGPKPQLREINAHSTKFNDASLKHLAKFSDLQSLFLVGTRVSGSGLKDLRSIKEFGIHLVNCPVTDESLAGVEVPEGCQYINLYGTRISDDGLRQLKLPSGIKGIGLQNTAVTDASLDLLLGLPNLDDLDVRNTQVTPQGIKRFQAKRPKCQVQ